MKLAWVVFERDVPVSHDERRRSFFASDGYDIERTEDGAVHVLRDRQLISLDGYAYTYMASAIAALEPAGEARAAPLSLASTADSGAAVDQGLAGTVGSTPARSAKRQRKEGT